MVISLNCCSQNGGNLYRAQYYNGNPNIGPRVIGNLDQYPCGLELQCPQRARSRSLEAAAIKQEAADLEVGILARKRAITAQHYETQRDLSTYMGGTYSYHLTTSQYRNPTV